MSKPIAIAFSDLHLHLFKDFDDDGSRLYQSIKAAVSIMEAAEKFGVPILFCGDLVHIPKEIDQRVLEGMLGIFTAFPNLDFYAISGNHDHYRQNLPDNPSPSYINTLANIFPRFHNMDLRTKGNEDIQVWGIPYYSNEKHTMEAIKKAEKEKRTELHDDKYNILILHTDLPGAKDAHGFEVPKSKHIPSDLDMLFEPWDLVLVGHIHRPQRLCNNAYMLGSPIQQNRGDVGVPMGYWKIYKDKAPQFVYMKDFPHFIPKSATTNKRPIDYVFDDTVNQEEWAEDVAVDFLANGKSDDLAKSYLERKKIKSKAKRKLLIELLNQSR